MEKIKLGQYKICETWDDVTLSMWQEYMRRTDVTGNVDIVDTVEIFSDIPRSIIYQLPEDLFARILEKMKFLNEKIDDAPNNTITIDGETYVMNTSEKLKVKEYLDATTILENDKFNYAGLFAVLCRLPNEEYDDAFIADKLGDRITMYENCKAKDIFQVLAFFLNLYTILNQHSISYLMAKQIQEDGIELVKNIENSRRLTDYIIPSRVQQIMTLRKLKKSLKAIL